MSGKRQRRQARRGLTQVTPLPQQQKPDPARVDRPTGQYEKDIDNTLRTEVDAIQAFIQEYKTNNQQSTRVQWISLWVAVFTASVVFAYTAVTYSLLGTSQEANRINREALISVQRAFVSLKSIQAYYVPDTQGNITTWDFQGEWENSGTTHTQTLRQHSNYWLDDKPLPNDYAFPDVGPGNDTISFIAPKATVLTGVMSIPSDALREVQAGKYHLYFWGWTAYRDIFRDSKTHLTEYCRKVGPINGDVTKGGGMRFIYAYCGSHNCVDESCEDYAEAEKKLKGD
jgi:hypothetical protein